MWKERGRKRENRKGRERKREEKGTGKKMNEWANTWLGPEQAILKKQIYSLMSSWRS